MIEQKYIIRVEKLIFKLIIWWIENIFLSLHQQKQKVWNNDTQ